MSERSEKMSGILARARSARAEGRFGEARDLLRRYLRGHGQDAAAHHLAAIVAWEGGQREDAITHVRKAARLAPRTYLFRLEHARMLALSQDREAVAESEAALALRPDDLTARFQHACILFNGPNPDDAAPLLEALAEDMSSPGEALAMLASLHIAERRAEQALECADAALSAGVRAPEIFEIRGRALLALDRPEDARLAFATALRAEPDRLLSLRGYASACGRAGRLANARQAVAEHVRLLPFEVAGAADAPLTILVGNLLGRDGVFSSVRPDRAYGLTNYIGDLSDPELRLVHYAPNFVESSEVARGCGGADLVFNNIANAEMIAEGGGGARLAASYAATGLPVINAVEATERCTREGNYLRLRDDPHFIYPRTARFDTGDDPAGTARRMLEAFDPPFLLRPTVTNNRGGLRLIEAPEDLSGEGELMARASYYAIEYHPSTHTCRKGDSGSLYFRAAVVDGECIPERLGWSPGPFSAARIVRREMDYDGRGLTDMEKTYLTRPEEIFGADLNVLFAGLMETVGLDVYGLDFGRTRDGEVVVFEVNAAMRLVHSGNDRYAPYRFDYRRAFNRKVVDFFRRRAGRG